VKVRVFVAVEKGFCLAFRGHVLFLSVHGRRRTRSLAAKRPNTRRRPWTTPASTSSAPASKKSKTEVTGNENQSRQKNEFRSTTSNDDDVDGGGGGGV